MLSSNSDTKLRKHKCDSSSDYTMFIKIIFLSSVTAVDLKLGQRAPAGGGGGRPGEKHGEKLH